MLSEKWKFVFLCVWAFMLAMARGRSTLFPLSEENCGCTCVDPNWVTFHVPFRYYFFKYDYSRDSCNIESAKLLFLLLNSIGNCQTLSELSSFLSVHPKQKFIYEATYDYSTSGHAVSLYSYNLSPYDSFERIEQISSKTDIFNFDNDVESTIGIVPLMKRIDFGHNVDPQANVYSYISSQKEGYINFPFTGLEIKANLSAVVINRSIFINRFPYLISDNLEAILSRLNCTFAALRELQSRHAFLDSIKREISLFGSEEVLLSVSNWDATLRLGFFALTQQTFKDFLLLHFNSPHLSNFYSDNENLYEPMSKEVTFDYAVRPNGTIELTRTSFFGLIPGVKI